MTLIFQWFAGISQHVHAQRGSMQRGKYIHHFDTGESVARFQKTVTGVAPRPAVAESRRRAGSGIQPLLPSPILSVAHQLCNKQTDWNKHNGSCAVVFVHFFAHSYGWKQAGVFRFNQIHLIRLEGLISLCWAPVGLIPCQLYTHQNSNKPFVLSFG